MRIHLASEGDLVFVNRIVLIIIVSRLIVNIKNVTNKKPMR